MYPRVNFVCNRCFKRLLFCLLIILNWTQDLVEGQGRMLMPPGRSSMWRFGYDTPVNHNDNVLNCGGTLHRYSKANGKCGVCGDPWGSEPRDNEAGGAYANGIITAVYTAGGTIDVIIDDVVGNGGFFEFRLCDNSKFSVPDSHECFQNGLLTIKNTSDNKFRDIRNGENKVQLVLPDNFLCDQCVLQWKYRTAEHYGCDKNNGTEKCCFGCGEIQSEYYACADIAIVTGDTNIYTMAHQGYDMPQENVKIHTLKRKKRTPVTRRRMQEGIQVISNGPVESLLLPYTSIINRGARRPADGLNAAPQRNIRWSWNSQPALSSGVARNGNVNELQSTNIGGLNGRGGISAGATLNGQPPIFNGNTPPVRSLIRVDRPVVRTPIFRNERPVTSSTLFPTGESSGIRRTFFTPLSPTADALMIRPLTNDPLVKYTDPNSCKAIGPFRTKEMDQWCRTQCRGGNCVINECSCNGKRYPSDSCEQCPYGKCMDKSTELNSIYPGIFNNYTTFLECGSYDKIYGLGNYKVLAEGLPECGHPRFKRQITVSLEDEGYGCCGTRPQVIMPLTVKSENVSYNVVQLPEDRNQFLVRGVCGRNSTVSCPMCVPEYNFQWVLVYDPKLDTKPPVNFVPVKFAHYCRCINPGYNLGK